MNPQTTFNLDSGDTAQINGFIKQQSFAQIPQENIIAVSILALEVFADSSSRISSSSNINDLKFLLTKLFDEIIKPMIFKLKNSLAITKSGRKFIIENFIGNDSLLTISLLTLSKWWMFYLIILEEAF